MPRPPRPRRRISFGNVVATLALFIAIGGVSWAATSLPKNSVGKKQLKSNAVVSKKVKNGSLAAGDFKGGQLPAGPKGSKGPVGQQGPKGQPGAPGATTSVLTGRTSLAGTDSFFSPSGISTAGATEAPVQILSPGVAATARNLSVRLDSSPGPAASRAFTLRVNGADTALTCTIVNAGQTCTSGGASVAVPAGSLLSLENDASAAPLPSGVQFGLTLQP
jgi:hypothetical protein